MEKLRKITDWLWQNKERMVLFVMVGFLCYRVYEVAFPPEPEAVAPPAPPRQQLPPPEEAPEDLLPPRVPGAPPRDLPEDYSSFVRKNPFSYQASMSGGGGEQQVANLDIELLNIQGTGAAALARIRSGGRSDWYSVGDPIGNDFRLEEINAEEGTAVVYAERLQRRIPLPPRGTGS